MPKVFIVKWSQNMIFVDGNPFFGPTPDFEILDFVKGVWNLDIFDREPKYDCGLFGCVS